MADDSKLALAIFVPIVTVGAGLGAVIGGMLGHPWTGAIVGAVALPVGIVAWPIPDATIGSSTTTTTTGTGAVNSQLSP